MAHPLDVLVGKRLYQRRLQLGISAQELGDRIGVAAKQIESYESGADRINASGIWVIAAAINVPVMFFYDGVDGQTTSTDEVCDDLAAAQSMLDRPRALLGSVKLPAMPKSGLQALATLRAVCGGIFKTAARTN